MGRGLVKKPELRKTGEKSFTFVTIAVDEGYGEKKTTGFYTASVFGQPAEYLVAHGNKGDHCMVSGRLNTRSYEREGKKYNELGVVATNVQLIPKATATAQHQPAQQAQPVQSAQVFTPADGAGASYDINDLINGLV